MTGHEVFDILEYSRGKYEAICLTAKLWMTLGHTAGPGSEAHQEIYKIIKKNLSNSKCYEMLW